MGSGDITLGYLERTKLADYVAGQKKYDIDITGGTISGVTITDSTIEGDAIDDTANDDFRNYTWTGWILNGFEITLPVSGLTYTLPEGQAIVNGIVVDGSAQGFTMQNNYIDRIWLKPDGTYQRDSVPAANYNDLPLYNDYLPLVQLQSSGGNVTGNAPLGNRNPELKLATDNAYHLSDFVDLFYISSGTNAQYANLFRFGINNGVKWYFSNIGMAVQAHNLINYGGTDYVLNYIKAGFKHCVIARQNSFAYVLGQKIHIAGFIWVAAAGTSAGSSPFTTGYSVGSTVNDGSVTWTAIYPYYGAADYFWLDVAGDFTTYAAPDSHDSYASTFAWLIGQYVALTGNIGWLSETSPLAGQTYKAALVQIVNKNLVNQISNNLTHTFQGEISPVNGAAYTFQFLEDNCESYRGLNYGADVMNAVGDTTNRDAFIVARNLVDAGVYALFGTASSGSQFFVYYYGATWDAADALDPVPWYPYLQSQVFPEACGLPFSTTVFQAARTWLAEKLPSWWALNSKDTFPNLQGNYLAATAWNDAPKALAGINIAERFHIGGSAGTLIIQEFAYYLAIKERIASAQQIVVSDGYTLAIQDSNENVNLLQLSNTPAFKAYMGNTQHLGAATLAKLNMDTEEYDTDSNYSTVNKRFTPLIAGKYRISAKANFINGGAGGIAYLYIYKNGAAVGTRVFAFPNNAADLIIGIEETVTMNGTTDYVEVYGQTSVTANPDVYFGAALCTFEGFRLIGV